MWSGQKLYLEVSPKVNDIMEDHPDPVNLVKLTKTK